MDLLTITSSNNGADDEVVVGLDLQLVTFLARLFRITGSGTDEVGGGRCNLDRNERDSTYPVSH